MSDGKNPFGGGNPHSLYVPMSETEQEVLERLAQSGELIVRVHGWGVVPNPPVTFGDSQLVIPMVLRFDRPEVPIPVSHFDLELATVSGISLFREKQSCEYVGQPIWVGSGVEVQMVWHIAIRAMDPGLVKSIVPGAKGLTSRAFDRDTGDLTAFGNMKLDEQQKKLLAIVREGEARMRAENRAKVRGS